MIAKIFDCASPLDPPSVYEWIEHCLTKRKAEAFLTIGDIVASRVGSPISGEAWVPLTPRTAMFMRFFETLRSDSTSTEIVEALHTSGFTAQQLDTLPEAILVPLRECIVDCQAQPPVSWGKDLLNLVDREDVNMFLLPGQRRRSAYAPLLVGFFIHFLVKSLTLQDTNPRGKCRHSYHLPSQ